MVSQVIMLLTVTLLSVLYFSAAAYEKNKKHVNDPIRGICADGDLTKTLHVLQSSLFLRINILL